MNLPSLPLVAALLLCEPQARAMVQDPPPPAEGPAAKATRPPDAVELLVREMQAAEQRLQSLVLEMQTSGQFGNGDEFQTTGSLQILRGPPRRLRSNVQFAAAGIEGRTETLQGPDGILIYQQDPAFGEVLVQIPAVVVADLEWAGEVLRRADLPGMKDRRADSPLGSGMLSDLRRQFQLAVGERKERGGEAGVWLPGPRHAGLPEHEADLPLADRVELFVRQRDLALLEVQHFQGDKVVQRLEVKRLQVDAPVTEASLKQKWPALKPRDVAGYPPLAEPIERALKQAEARAGEGVRRPSRR
jgi:hypothetical protein